MGLLFGLVGLFNLVLLMPALVILNAFKWELFELPPTSQVWLLLTANAVVGTVVRYPLRLWGTGRGRLAAARESESEPPLFDTPVIARAATTCGFGRRC